MRSEVSLAQRAFDAQCEANSSDGHRATVGRGEFKSLTAVYRLALLARQPQSLVLGSVKY